MKSRKLLIGLLTFMFGAGVFVLSTSETFGQEANKATLDNLGGGIDNGWGYLSGIRNNQTTGTVNLTDVMNARNQVSGFRASNALGLNWTSLGPDNYSGRTRALLLSNQDAQRKTIFAGGVSGGLWKSTTSGLTWTQINTDNIILNVSCIAQAANGDIYVGTGENFASGRFNMFSGFIGQGIYKSTDGTNFSRLASTDPGSFNNPDAPWAFVNKIAVSDSKIYAATNGGLQVSTDGGQTWTLAKAGSANLNEVSTEVDIASDGTVAASVGNKLYISANGASDGFILESGQVGENELPHDAIARIELAFAPTDASTLYAVLIADGTASGYLQGQLFGIYVSKDKGQTWRLIGPGASTVFNVFGNYANTTHYGDYVASVVVSDTNADLVYVGGINVWEGKKVLETGFYQWQQKSSGNVTTFHNIVFDPINSGIAYVSTDQGVYTTSNDFASLATLNRNYRTSMFYTVAYDDKGRVLGGTQGNGVIFIDGEGNTPEAGTQILSSNVGGSVEMSMINPTAMFYSSNGGAMYRSADLGVSIANEFVDAITSTNSGVFMTPFRMWESFNNPNSRDSITYITDVNHAAGDVMQVKSKTGSFPFNYTFTEPLLKGDSVKIQDIVSNRFFIGVTNAVYMSKGALDFGNLPKWFQIASIDGIPSAMAYSKDANYLFVGTQSGKVYRIANIALAYDSIRADISSPAVIISTSLIQDFAGRYVTSISVDPNNDASVVITLGNYGNTDFVYRSTNALDQTPVFNSIQGNLPKMPVYSSLIEMNTSNLIIGTDFGIFSASSLGANTQWTSENNGMGAIPIMSIRQQTATRPFIDGKSGITNTGAIYVASHGNGIFENRMYVGIDRPFVNGSNGNELINVYPNPVNNQINFNLNMENPSQVSVKVYDLKGNLVDFYNHGLVNKGQQKVSFKADNLINGTYVLQVTVGNEMKSAKFVVVK